MPIDWTSFSPVEEPQSEDTIDWSGFSPIDEPNNFKVIDSGATIKEPAAPRSPELSTIYGGPRKTLPDIREVQSALGETLPAAHEFMTRPAIPIPKFEVTPESSVPGAIAKSAANLALGIPEFFETPAGGLTAALAPAAPLLTALGFTGLGAQNLAEASTEAGSQWDKLSAPEKAAALVNIGGAGAMTALPALHAAGQVGARISPTEAAKSLTQGESNAIPERGAAPVSVEVPSANSEAVGARISGAEEPAIPQEQANAPVEATPETEGALTPKTYPGEWWNIDHSKPLRVFRGKSKTAGEPESEARFGKAEYWTPEKSAAQHFADSRGEGASVEESAVTLADRKVLNVERPDESDPRFKKLLESLGKTKADWDMAKEHVGLEQWAGRISKSKGGEKTLFPGKIIADAARDAGYDTILAHNGGPDAPSHTEIAFLDKVQKPPPEGDASRLNTLMRLNEAGELTPEQKTEFDALNAKDAATKNKDVWLAQMKADLAAKKAESLATETDPSVIDKAENWANEKLKGGGTSSGADVLAAYAVKGAITIARGVKDFGEWSTQMVKDLGEAVKPHLEDIWNRVRAKNETVESFAKAMEDPQVGMNNKDSNKVGMSVRSIADLDRLAEIRQRNRTLKDDLMAKAEGDKSKTLQAIAIGGRVQLPREAIEVATNTGGWIEGGRIDPKLGPRPLDWKNNPEVQDWLRKNAERLNIGLPEGFPMTKGEKGLAKNVRSVEGGIKEGGSIINPGSELAKLAERLGGKVTGLAERIRARRETAGMTAPTVPGEGLSPEASVQKGRARISAGENPESAMTEFEKTQRLNSSDIELVRAHTENLARTTNQALDQFGRQSEQFKAAHKIESDWAKRTKAMQTEWARQGHAQQGEVDIDTGTFSGLSRYKEQVSKTPFTPDQEVTAKKKAKVAKDATDKADVTQQVLLDHIEKKATAGNAEKRAKDAADKTVRENAVRVADAENAHRTAQQTRDNGIAKIESDAEKRAGDAASKTVRENAIRVAKEENAARIKQMQRDVDVAALAEKRAKDALDAANKRARDIAARAAREEQRRLADPLAAIWEKAKGYIEQGMDNFDDIRAKLATDLGLPIDRVTRMLAQDKRAKFLTDEAWRAQERARMVKQQAKAWVRSLDIPGYIKAIKMVPKLAFTAKVMGHGPVALGTHAPMLAFQPNFWGTYLKNYAKMYRMVGKPTPKGQANAKSFYEAKVQDLLHDPLYTTAQRAGLINDPMHFEDYNSPEMMAWMGKFTAMGNRGYSVLKMIRQDMFNYHWNKLPKTMQTSGVAEAIADSVNHATGVVSTTPIQGSHLAFFAPRLEMSRAAWLAADPMKALATVPRWSKATDAQKWAAIQQAKEKAWVAGTMLGMLAINQGILNAVNSEQKINFDDPLKSDFLKFKVAGMKASYGNAMLSMARLVPRLIDAREGSAARLKNREYPDESVYKLAGEYARSQMAPAASIAADLFLKSDFQHRPLPNSDQDVPKRLRDQGVTPYTWPEYWLEKATPIPVEEGIKEVYKNGLGMTDEQMKRTRMAVASIAFMGATGGNLTEDYPAQLRDMIKPDSKASNQEIVDAFKKLVINEPTPEKKQKRINQILSENNPFTADGEPKAFMTTSKEKEEKFVEGLSPKKKEEYKQALIERAKSYQRLQDALNSTK